MKLSAAVIDELLVTPGAPAGLAHRSTSALNAPRLNGDGSQVKKLAEKDLEASVKELAVAQEKLWADGTRALLVVLQAMDAAGKDGTIRHVMSGVNPQGCTVEDFKQPSTDELDHDFLWHAHRAAPKRGMIGIFNRSHYEEVLVVRVHPELLARGKDASDVAPSEQVWRGRYEDINTFEHHLERSGIRIVKIFLHVSQEEQRSRFLARLDDPDKNWKFSLSDLAERQHWDEYQTAYEEAITATSTAWAPWYVVPADHKYALRALVGGIVVHAIDGLDLRPPQLSPDQRDALARAKVELLHEPG
jgi:PPK2 family polyphosphate:nucleotide phosphotransferase